MRIQPPKTRKKKFTIEEFKEFALRHYVVDKNRETFPVIELWKDLREVHEKAEAIDIFLTFWPQSYQYYIANIFLALD